MLEGIDFSWARPSGADIVAAGKQFVVRYVPYPGDGGKGLTAAEIKDYRAHNLPIAVVFESSTGRAKGGLTAGKIDGAIAQAGMAGLGFPNAVIYFAVDFNAQVSDQPALDAYLKGAASVIGLQRVGVYGSYAVCARVNASRTAMYFWQTYAWSSGKTFPGHLYQYKNGQAIIGGGPVDFTRALKADFGQIGESGMDITVQVREKWHPTVTGTQSNGVLRATPDRSAAIVSRVESIITVAEVKTMAPAPNNNWRLVETPDRTVLYALRSDWISDGPAPVVSQADYDKAVTDQKVADSTACQTLIGEAVAKERARVRDVLGV